MLFRFDGDLPLWLVTCFSFFRGRTYVMYRFRFKVFQYLCLVLLKGNGNIIRKNRFVHSDDSVQ